MEWTLEIFIRITPQGVTILLSPLSDQSEESKQACGFLSREPPWLYPVKS